MNKSIILGRGWHDIEGHFESKISWRWTHGVCYIQLLDNVQKIIIHAEPATIDQEIIVYGVVDKESDFIKLKEVNIKVEQKINIECEVSGFN
jgi:hypothetical protein